ncbi:hypothetical protein KAU93_03840 [Candidatus Bathyarchaeota archaeon]|nr:hypothetical protein [Candidatus Bathyarchaeota archaeon]
MTIKGFHRPFARRPEAKTPIGSATIPNIQTLVGLIILPTTLLTRSGQNLPKDLKQFPRLVPNIWPNYAINQTT